MKLNGSQIVLEVLKEQGVDTIFGYPGGTILNIFDELYKYGDTFNHILTAHEQGASHAADGYARATGKVGVCFATSGPGSTNLVTGIATAYMDSIPVVAITCNYATEGLGRDSFQEVDITGITMPITKHNFMVKDVTELADTIRRAFEIAQSGRKGPVLVDIPKDITAAMCEYEPQPKVEVDNHKTPKEKCLKRAVELISQAKKPLIYVGGGAILSEVGEDLITFAEKIDAPVVSSLMGLGAVPNGHPLHLGLIGMHGHFECNKAAHDCDVLIVCGARFSDRVAGNRAKFAPNAEILHIDIDSAEMDKNIVSNYHLRGNLADVIPTLTRELEQLDHSEWRTEIEGFKRPFVQLQIGDYVNPQAVIEAVDNKTPDDTVVVTDVGQHQLWAAQFYKYKLPHTLLTSGGLGTMGYSMGAAMGAAVGCPDKRVIMFVGDGGFHMNLTELATMASYNIPVIMFVMNNTVLGMVRQWQKIFYNNRFSDTDPHRATDFVKVAEAFGVKGMRINTNDEIDTVIDDALKVNGPVLIECRISPDSNVLPMIPPGGSVKDIKEEM
ncbi:MAG: biosynthetic-type acetolactate synthase large subunit [Eubacterium sp.]|nr:biosynthetic-type acetolactate synthase large subunit [Eubacterium sp.]